MVHTVRHKTPRPRPKQNYVLVSNWKANEGLVFGEPFSPPQIPTGCFSLLFSPSMAWPVAPWWGDADRKNMKKT